jgi:hypothetical protein
MMVTELWTLAQNRPPVAIAMLTATALVGLTVVWVVRKILDLVRGERPDEPLSNMAMLIGFGWSSEAVWLLTGPSGADLVTPIRIALFAVFEVILIVFMIRAKRNMRILGRPGRAGRNAWLVATGMSLVAVWTAHNAGEAFLRLLVPVLLTAMWWDGLVGETPVRQDGATSWRWTPRRLLLWLGAIEPGERDVETVHRERLTQQMTRLEFKRRHGTEPQRESAARRLARLSLVADDDIVTEVRRRVDRAPWFEVAHPDFDDLDLPPDKAPVFLAPVSAPPAQPEAPVSGAPVGDEPTGQKVRQDVRTAQQIEDVVRAMRRADPRLSQRKIADQTLVPLTTVRRILQQDQTGEVAQPEHLNGQLPELEDVVR